MKLELIMKAAGSRVSGGDPFLWNCWGPNAHYMEFRDIDGRGYCHCVYDTRTYDIYQIHVEVPGTDECYAWFNPVYKDAYIKEATERQEDWTSAWDDVGYTFAETGAEILRLIENIGNGVYVNSKVTEPIISEELAALSEIEHDKLVEEMRNANKTLRKLEIDQDNPVKQTFTVNVDVRYVLELETSSMDEASKLAQHWLNDKDSVNASYIDNYIIKESVERNLV